MTTHGLARSAWLTPLFVLALTGLGRAAPPAVQDEIDVRRIQLEVRVSDPRGKALPSLIQDDFELLHGGEPLEILHFEAPPGNGAAKSPSADDASAVGSPSAPLHLLILVDTQYLDHSAFRAALPALRRFLLRSLGPEDRVLLAVAGEHLEIRRAFSTLHSLVGEDLETIETFLGASAELSQFRQTLQDIQSSAATGRDLQTQDADRIPRQMLRRIEGLAAQTHHGTLGAFENVRRMAEALAGIPGRREILHLGGTPPAGVATSLMAAWQSAFGQFSRRRIERPLNPARLDDSDPGNSSDPLELQRRNNVRNFEALGIDLGRFDAAPAVTAVEKTAHLHGVRIHTFDLGRRAASQASLAGGGVQGMEASSFGDAASLEMETGGGLAGSRPLEALARRTGGQILGNTELRDALEALVKPRSPAYVLTFEPPRQGLGEIHPLEVRLPRRHRRLELEYRTVYRLESPDAHAASLARSALFLDEPINPLRAEIEVAPADRGQADTVALTVRVPLVELALEVESQAHTGQLSVFVTSGDLTGDSLPVRKLLLPVHVLHDELLTSLGRSISATLDVPVKPGAGRLSVALRDDVRGAHSTLVVPLQTAP